MQNRRHLADTGYEGTLSDIDPTKKTSRENRGKVKCNKRAPKTTARAMSDTLVTRADGSQYIIPRKKARVASARTTAKRRSAEQVISEAIKYGAHLTMDERRRINGL